MNQQQMEQIEGRLRAIAEFGKKYQQEYLHDRIQQRELYRADWFAALYLFFRYSFYSGRRDEISKRFMNVTICGLREYLGDSQAKRESMLTRLRTEGWLPSRNAWQMDNHPIHEILHGVNRTRDREMVISSLGYTVEVPEHNIVERSLYLVSDVCVKSAFEELQTLRGVGPKIAALFLRDLATIYEFEEKLEDNELVYLQPVDTWVRQVCQAIRMPFSSDAQLTRQIVEACRYHQISPVVFNQGAWYVGANSFDILMRNIGHLQPTE